MKALKKIVVFIFVVNVFALPINIYFSYSYGKVIFFKNQYILKNVKIENLVDLSYQDDQGSYEGYRVSYFLCEKDSIRKDSIAIGRGSRGGSKGICRFP